MATRSNTKEVSRSFSWRQRIQLYLISRVAALVVWVIGSTLRIRVEGEDHLDPSLPVRPAILSFWHNQIFLGTYFWRNRNIMVMASPHFDGQYTARMIGLFGFCDCQGSSSRGAVRALLQMKKHLAQGFEVAFTVDGPRGPVYRVQPGPLWLSRKTGVPIVPFHIEPARYWELNSWDRFRIPKPFSPVLVKIWKPFLVGPEMDEGEALEMYQREMDALREYCERAVGRASGQQ